LVYVRWCASGFLDYWQTYAPLSLPALLRVLALASSPPLLLVLSLLSLRYGYL
jgi:hypothetical protein